MPFIFYILLPMHSKKEKNLWNCVFLIFIRFEVGLLDTKIRFFNYVCLCLCVTDITQKQITAGRSTLVFWMDTISTYGDATQDMLLGCYSFCKDHTRNASTQIKNGLWGEISCLNEINSFYCFPKIMLSNLAFFCSLFDSHSWNTLFTYYYLISRTKLSFMWEITPVVCHWTEFPP